MDPLPDAVLFEPVTMRDWTCRNRVVMPPMVTVRDPVSPQGVAWYERRAAGGVGLVIVEAVGCPRFGADITVGPLRQLAEAVHRHGALIAVQLFPTRIGASQDVNACSEAGLAAICDQYRVAARLCLEAGIDGVEPHGAHGYLLNRAFSPTQNRRTDRYGGSPANRMRLALDIVRAVRDAVGPRLLLLYRHTPVQKDAYGLEESLDLARELVASGVDVLDLSPSSLEAPGDLAAPFMGLGARVIAVGSLDEPGRATEAVTAVRADLVAIGRGLIADPDWPRKVAAGDWSQVVRCVKCNEKCFGNLKRGIPIECAQWN